MVKYTQTNVRLLPTDCLSVFDHFVGLAFKGLTSLVAQPYLKNNSSSSSSSFQVRYFGWRRGGMCYCKKEKRSAFKGRIFWGVRYSALSRIFYGLKTIVLIGLITKRQMKIVAVKQGQMWKISCSEIGSSKKVAASKKKLLLKSKAS